MIFPPSSTSSIDRWSLSLLALIINFQLLSFSFTKTHQLSRTVVSKQAEFEKAVFAKTARVNARGDGESVDELGRAGKRDPFFPFSTSSG